MLYQERDSSAYLSQAQSSLVQWGLDGKLRTILDTITTEALRLKIDPNILGAVIITESSGKGLIKEKLVIRFEAHIFDRRTKKNYSGHFSYNQDKPWTEQKYRVNLESEDWKNIHTGKQDSEYGAFNLAKELNEDAAYQSISMGMGQIMGFNYKSAGYNSAKEMFDAFSKSEEEQIKGMIKFIENNPKMLKALQDGDLETFVKFYNGPGQVDTYLKIMNKNMETIKTYAPLETKKEETKTDEQIDEQKQENAPKTGLAHRLFQSFLLIF